MVLRRRLIALSRCRVVALSRCRVVPGAQSNSLGPLFDPVLAVHTPDVENRQHQVTELYQEMLPCRAFSFLPTEYPGGF
jgi:hypothetical protein